METELKLRFADQSVLEKFLQDEWYRRLLPPGQRRQIMMHSLYLDTPGHDLAAKMASLRLRHENNHYVLTVKQGDKAQDGLHQRHEWSVNWPEYITDQDVTAEQINQLFRDAARQEPLDHLLESLLSSIDGKQLVRRCEVRFTRQAALLRIDKTTIETALDQGEFLAAESSETFCELELELKGGRYEPLMALGEQLTRTFNLIPEPRSKLARCLDLLRSKGEKDG